MTKTTAAETEGTEGGKKKKAASKAASKAAPKKAAAKKPASRARPAKAAAAKKPAAKPRLKKSEETRAARGAVVESPETVETEVRDVDVIEDAEVIAETPIEALPSDDDGDVPELTPEEQELKAIYGDDLGTPATAHAEYSDQKTADEDRPMLPEINARDERKAQWQDRRDRRRQRRDDRDRQRHDRGPAGGRGGEPRPAVEARPGGPPASRRCRRAACAAGSASRAAADPAAGGDQRWRGRCTRARGHATW
jgi:hypothetical protein